MKKYDMDKTWCIVEDHFSIETNKHFEGLFTQGNGYMHARGSFEEGINGAPQNEEYMRMHGNVTLEKPRDPRSKWGTYIPGIIGKHPLLQEEIINLPWFLETVFALDGEKLDMELCDIQDYRRWLDLRDGCLHRDFVWHGKNGAVVSFEFSRFISMDNRHLCLQRAKIKFLAGKGVLYVKAGIDGKVRTNGYNHFKEIAAAKNGDGILSMTTTTDNGNSILQMSHAELDDQSKPEIRTGDDSIACTWQIQAVAGEGIVLNKATAVVTDRERGNLKPRAAVHIRKAREQGFERLYEKHAAVWSALWEKCDVRIDGDDEAQLAIRMSIYHLVRSCPGTDPRVAICAKGYAGEAYFGRYFWDTELSMLPFFIYTHPEAAKNLVLFRCNTLDGARRNAEAYGYKGARYPWESSITGEEQCPSWQYADNEIHITADVVYAMLHYAEATGDTGFIRNYGIDVLVETARYWTCRVDRNRKGYYELLGVMGPDEYLPSTRNNAFTNRMVKFSLKKTVEYLRRFEKEEPDLYGEILKRLELAEEEIGKFAEVEAGLMLPYDEETGIIPQSEDFESYADLDFDEIWKDRTKPFGHFISQERNYRSKALKQADALELMMLYPNEFTVEQLRKTYEYYEPITTHDSSLSAAVHGIIASWLCKNDEAEKFLKKVAAMDMSLEKKGAAEGIHIANCGGLWQLIVFGLGGLKSGMWEKEIVLKPNLPRKWERLSFKLAWRRRNYRISITKNGYETIEE